MEESTLALGQQQFHEESGVGDGARHVLVVEVVLPLVGHQAQLRHLQHQLAEPLRHAGMRGQTVVQEDALHLVLAGLHVLPIIQTRSGWKGHAKQARL